MYSTTFLQIRGYQTRLRTYQACKIKLASCHLLLYVVYTCHKNFIDTFNCCKQKWKVAPFNLAHPVWCADTVQSWDSNIDYLTWSAAQHCKYSRLLLKHCDDVLVCVKSKQLQSSVSYSVSWTVGMHAVKHSCVALTWQRTQRIIQRW